MTSRRTKISPKSGRGLGHVTSTIFGSTVGYPSDSLACCLLTQLYYYCHYCHVYDVFESNKYLLPTYLYHIPLFIVRIITEMRIRLISSRRGRVEVR